MQSKSTALHVAPPDLTQALEQINLYPVGTGAFGIVYHHACRLEGQLYEVAAKVVKIPVDIDDEAAEDFERRLRRELSIWRRLDHPDIVPLLGTAFGFGAHYPCMVSMWMPHGTLSLYIKECKAKLDMSHRLQLIKGMAAGLEYCKLNDWALHGLSN
ncbi:kinase-like protein [Gyrodon lividus]|nr:kinase-like protein [Gyrodon lividus]